MMRTYILLLKSILTICFLLFTNQESSAQSRRFKKNAPHINADLHQSIQYRSLGPFRGGRSAAVVGVSNQPKVFYFGATGGGVWKTIDGGKTY